MNLTDFNVFFKETAVINCPIYKLKKNNIQISKLYFFYKFDFINIESEYLVA